jgi:GNAT superfamily N-acetyltransferase
VTIPIATIRTTAPLRTTAREITPRTRATVTEATQPAAGPSERAAVRSAAMPVEIVTLENELVGDAAALLAERHAAHRDSEPLLPAHVDFAAQVDAALGSSDRTAVAALRDGRLAGYLIGAPAGDGRVEVGIAGHAAAEPELARDLYAAAAQAWVDRGATRHSVYVPAHDTALVDAWFRLAFGLQFCFAVRDVAAEPAFEVSGVTVRTGDPDDLAAAAELERSLWEHQVRSPSFSGLELPPLAPFVEDWAGTWSDPSFAHFVAERNGRIVGQALLYVRPTGDLRIPENAIDLAQAETVPSARGAGVGRALFAHAMRWAHEHGYHAMTTDWRMVNLLSSRFWPRRGFRPTFLRLYRSVP